jgi:ElaB/YqjD/DUF883 family membrane-anchored ribosome-binding protein
MGEMSNEEYLRQNEEASKLCERLVHEASRKNIHPIILFSHLYILTRSYEKLLIEEDMLSEEEVSMIKEKAEEAVEQTSRKRKQK